MLAIERISPLNLPLCASIAIIKTHIKEMILFSAGMMAKDCISFQFEN